MKAKEYVDQVLRYLEADESVKRRLAVDLLEHINAAGGDEAIKRMGDPKDMAAELMDTLYTDKSEVIRELVRARAAMYRNGVYYRYYDYEYISKTKLFGLPLVHISGKPTMKPAKGIIAIGLTAVGVVAIGTFSVGIISFGALSAGLLFAFGGLALGGFAVGGVAAGIIAWGGLALGVYAMGGAAFASHIAVGGYANGTVAIGNTAVGEYTISTGDRWSLTSAVSKQEAQMLIERAYPDIWNWIVRMMTVFF